ncbi:unnamed protein product [Schistosoma curassoni]|uniref:Reverse transcriptase n=1 Tax=Schistosoma curassoni TaxID=6186 RepID=A0A183JQE2_9TREM|nr:unnamed protein product [Schistosoma curassoni]
MIITIWSAINSDYVTYIGPSGTNSALVLDSLSEKLLFIIIGDWSGYIKLLERMKREGLLPSKNTYFYGFECLGKLMNKNGSQLPSSSHPQSISKNKAFNRITPKSVIPMEKIGREAKNLIGAAEKESNHWHFTGFWVSMWLCHRIDPRSSSSIIKTWITTDPPQNKLNLSSIRRVCLYRSEHLPNPLVRAKVVNPFTHS